VHWHASILGVPNQGSKLKLVVEGAQELCECGDQTEDTLELEQRNFSVVSFDCKQPSAVLLVTKTIAVLIKMKT
jgi:hypothetical protein